MTDRLEYLRSQIRAQQISYGELAELQNLTEHIEPGDVELLEWAGVPESENAELLTPNGGYILVDAEGKVRGYDFAGYVVVEWTGQGPNGCAVNVRDCEGGNITADGLSIEERDALIAAIYANPIDDVDWPDVSWTTAQTHTREEN